MRTQRVKREQAGLCVPCFKGMRDPMAQEPRPMTKEEIEAWKGQARERLMRSKPPAQNPHRRAM